MRAALKKKFRDLSSKDLRTSDAVSPESLSSMGTQRDTSSLSSINSIEKLWDEAYDSLKRDEPKLMKAYEMLLIKEVNGGIKDDTIATNTSERRAQMQEVIEKGLAKTEGDAATKKSIGSIFQTLNSVKNVVGLGLEPSREATLAWSAMTAALPFLTNISDQSERFRDGISKVRDILVKTDVITPDRLKEITAAQKILKKVLVTLYQKILLFLIQAACYCNQSKIGQNLKDAIRLNDWDKQLKAVQDAEKAVLDLDLDIKAQHTVLYQRTTLMERRDEKDGACLAKLRLSDPRLDKKRIEDVKGGLVRESYAWILESHEFNAWREDGELLWIRGDPGKGKTMLLCGIIDELRGSKAYFFCQATNKAINTGVAVLRGLIYMMADENPQLIGLIRKRLDKHNYIFDANSWYTLSEVFEEMIEFADNTYVIIDALDECIEGRRELIRFILQNRTKARWIISSRNYSDVEEEVKSAPSLSLEINSSSVSEAVDRYIQHKVEKLADQKSYDPETKTFVLSYLRQNAQDTFLWVSLVCANLAETGQWLVKSTLKKFPSGLTEVYQRMWHVVLEKDGGTGLLHRILTISALVVRPLTSSELRVIVGIPNKTAAFLANILQDCGSFLAIREDVIEFVHQSAKEFIDGMTHDATQRMNLEIFSRSISAMSRVLKKDVYNLEYPDSSISQICVPQPDPLAGVAYSCVYWIQHLINGKRFSSSGDKNLSMAEENLIQQFLADLYLPWLEALSLLKSTGVALMMFHDLQSLISELYQHDEDSKKSNADIGSLVYDARRLFQYFRNTLQDFPLQIYYAGILFSPEDSILRRSFSEAGPSHLQVVKYADAGWSPSLARLDMRPGVKRAMVTAVCFCHDTKRLVFSYNDGIVQIWQIISMEIVMESQIGVIIGGQTDMIRHIAFTQINDKVICHRNSGVVTVWDLSTNHLIDLDLENTVNISSDGHLMAQATSTAVQIYSLLENELFFYKSINATLYVPQYQPTRFSQGPGTSLVFSSDSSSIAARTAVSTIVVWGVKPVRLRHEIQTSKQRLHTMTLGTKYLGTCEAYDVDTNEICSYALLSLYDFSNGHTKWTYLLDDTDVFVNVQINISLDDNFVAVSNGWSYVFDTVSGACIWKSRAYMWSWISPNLQYIVSLHGSSVPGSVTTLQEWACPEPGTASNIKGKLCKESIASISSDGRRIRTYYSPGNSPHNIVDLDTNTTLWEFMLWQQQQYKLSDSMMLVVKTNTRRLTLETTETRPRGLQIFCPTFRNGEKVTYLSIAPDDLHVAMAMKNKTVKIWHVQSQTEIRSIDCALLCTHLQWCVESKKLVISTNSGFILIDIEGKINGGVLRMDGASFVAFSEDALSFITWLYDADRVLVKSSKEDSVAAKKKFRERSSRRMASFRGAGTIPNTSGLVRGNMLTNDSELVTDSDSSVDDETNSHEDQKRSSRAQESVFSSEWPLNGESKAGDWVEWDITEMTGRVIEDFQPSGYVRVKYLSPHVNRLFKKLCYNSQILVICEHATHHISTHMLRIWDRGSKQLLIQSHLPDCIEHDSMTLQGRFLRFNCGVISINSQDISFGSKEEVFYDRQWIWKEGKKLVRVPANYQLPRSRYKNKTLGLDGEHGAYIILRSY